MIPSLNLDRIILKQQKELFQYNIDKEGNIVSAEPFDHPSFEESSDEPFEEEDAIIFYNESSTSQENDGVQNKED